jgi:hypothetical protein
LRFSSRMYLSALDAFFLVDFFSPRLASALRSLVDFLFLFMMINQYNQKTFPKQEKRSIATLFLMETETNFRWNRLQSSPPPRRQQEPLPPYQPLQCQRVSITTGVDSEVEQANAIGELPIDQRSLSFRGQSSDQRRQLTLSFSLRSTDVLFQGECLDVSCSIDVPVMNHPASLAGPFPFFQR